MLFFIFYYQLNLKVDLDTHDETAALTDATQVYALADDGRCGCHFWIGSQIVGQREQVIALNPELQTLQELHVKWQIVTQCEGLQFQRRRPGHALGKGLVLPRRKPTDGQG